MTPDQFKYYILGINSALSGQAPSKELWDEIISKIQTAQPAPSKLAPGQIIPFSDQNPWKIGEINQSWL